MLTDETNWAAWEAECDKAEIGLDLEHAVAYLQVPTWELRDLIADLRELSAEPVCPGCQKPMMRRTPVCLDCNAIQGSDDLVLHARPRHE